MPAQSNGSQSAESTSGGASPPVDQPLTPPLKSKHPRLYHSKSRNGCTRCRSRRVKCDEVRPVCSNCHRHGVPCHFDRPAVPSSKKSIDAIHARPSVPIRPRRSTTGELPPSPWSNTGDALDKNVGCMQKNRQLQLRLLHNFVVSTCLTFPGTENEAVRTCWSVEVPKLAFNYEPLLNEIFAVSALHLLFTKGDDRELQTCHVYFSGEAARGQRESLQHLDREEPDAVCFLSAMLIVAALASLQGRPMKPYAPPTQWMQLARGAGHVFETALEVIKDKANSKILPIISSSASFTDRKKLFQASNCQRLYSLIGPEIVEKLIHAEDEIDMTSTYADILAYVGSVQKAIEEREHPLTVCRRFMVFPFMTPSTFTQAIEERRPRALIILAYLFGLSTYTKDLWWIGSTGADEVLAINDFLGPEWESAMSWPMSLIRNQAANFCQPPTSEPLLPLR